MKELLEKYIRNRCSIEELKVVLPYIDTPSGRKELEALMQDDWENFLPEEAKEGIAEVWRHRLADSTKTEPGRVLPSGRIWLRYAAAITLVVGLGAYFFGNYHSQQTKVVRAGLVEKYNRRGVRSLLKLPDGTLVYLGAESRIKFPERFEGRSREIQLEGEAFFEVKPNKSKPFIIHSGRFQTRVLGTSFKVHSFNDKDFKVAVATGKVSVSSHLKDQRKKTLAFLTPGKMANWSSSDSSLTLSDIAIDHARDLKDGNLAFTDTRLDKIAEGLERWYDHKIVITAPEINAYQLSITINGSESVNKALDAITAATSLQYRITNNQIIIEHR